MNAGQSVRGLGRRDGLSIVRFPSSSTGRWISGFDDTAVSRGLEGSTVRNIPDIQWSDPGNYYGVVQPADEAVNIYLMVRDHPKRNQIGSAN